MSLYTPYPPPLLLTSLLSYHEQSAPQACGCEDGTNFCNYDSGATGTCEACDAFSTVADCSSAGLPPDGASDCEMRCFGDSKGVRDPVTDGECIAQCQSEGIHSSGCVYNVHR